MENTNSFTGESLCWGSQLYKWNKGKEVNSKNEMCVPRPNKPLTDKQIYFNLIMRDYTLNCKEAEKVEVGSHVRNKCISEQKKPSLE